MLTKQLYPYDNPRTKDTCVAVVTENNNQVMYIFARIVDDKLDKIARINGGWYRGYGLELEENDNGVFIFSKKSERAWEHLKFYRNIYKELQIVTADEVIKNEWYKDIRDILLKEPEDVTL